MGTGVSAGSVRGQGQGIGEAQTNRARDALRVSLPLDRGRKDANMRQGEDGFQRRRVCVCSFRSSAKLLACRVAGVGVTWLGLMGSFT